MENRKLKIIDLSKAIDKAMNIVAIERTVNLKDNTQNKYFIYKLNSDGTIIKINEGLVELNSLEKGISEENSKISLEQIVKSL